MSLRTSMVLVAVCLAATAQAATLEVPTPNTTISGIGVISGWKCRADGPLTVRFNGDRPIPLVYGSERSDTRGVCGDTNNGFVAIWNWANLGDGQHTAVVYDNGREFARSTFRVVTTGENFLADAAGQCVVPDFPASGENARFTWSTSTQHLELTDVGRHISPPGQRQHPFDGTWDFRFTYSNQCSRRPPSHVWLPLKRSSFLNVGQSLDGSLVVLETGQFEGHISIDAGPYLVSLSGLLAGREGRGVWFDFASCFGQWTARKR